MSSWSVVNWGIMGNQQAHQYKGYHKEENQIGELSKVGKKNSIKECKRKIIERVTKRVISGKGKTDMRIVAKKGGNKIWELHFKNGKTSKMQGTDTEIQI